ncbi:DUF6777 domain-containing protein [Streptomyces sp. NPDC060223]|uniref:DUF6777 domain-containing protein n=1 Tax=Streptomyces sp. NPDC060223 TaxID=3347077 RepID=UPI0036546345
MKRTRGIGRGAIALAAILTTLGLMATATACGYVAKVGVRAVARGAPAAAPFFARAIGLGLDIAVGEALSRTTGERKGNEAGLYGGTRDTGRCNKAKLVEFLLKPENSGKAKEWARVQGLDGVDEIPGFVRKLTPVVLRGDTLVKNHDFEKGKAVAFEALLEAGIAILVDQLGKPAVQCSCGNPLSTFDHDIGKTDVKFDDDNKKWPSYDSKKLTKVEPAPEDDPVEVYELVDIEKPNAGLERSPGSHGTGDKVLPTAPGDDSSPAVTVEVPDVTGKPVEEAVQILESAGFEAETIDEASDAATPGTVLGQLPAGGEQASTDVVVQLTLAAGTDPTTSPSQTGEPTGGSGLVGGTGDPNGTGEPGESGASGQTGEDGGPGADGGTSDSGAFFGGATGST